MKREDLLKSREYWMAKIQTDLYTVIEKYRTESGLNKTELAAELGFTKGYLTQVLNGEFDHKISKLVDLSLAVGKVPNIDFIDINVILQQDLNKGYAKIFSIDFEKNYQTGNVVNLNSKKFHDNDTSFKEFLNYEEAKSAV